MRTTATITVTIRGTDPPPCSGVLDVHLAQSLHSVVRANQLIAPPTRNSAARAGSDGCLSSRLARPARICSYAAAWVRIGTARALAALGALNSKMPFVSVAVAFPVSTSAGSSTTRNTSLEHASEYTVLLFLSSL